MAVVHRFDTLKAVPNITSSILIAHAENDWDIPHTHSDILFQAFLEPHLPAVDMPTDPLTISQEVWDIISKQSEARRFKRNQILSSKTIPNFGTIDQFVDGPRKVALVKTLAGGHDYLGVQEGLIDIIARNFEL
ncbi:hypothetical protein JR316_0007163 [Psilocybe cubensis]|nr:hypothetical protein JR316_0007163 [Psilocybe cubensis]KAH9480563.1 hypothetical protein JR316_0007163 [Psilocybe cubensis]